MAANPVTAAVPNLNSKYSEFLIGLKPNKLVFNPIFVVKPIMFVFAKPVTNAVDNEKFDEFGKLPLLVYRIKSPGKANVVAGSIKLLILTFKDVTLDTPAVF